MTPHTQYWGESCLLVGRRLRHDVAVDWFGVRDRSRSDILRSVPDATATVIGAPLDSFAHVRSDISDTLPGVAIAIPLGFGTTLPAADGVTGTGRPPFPLR